MPIVNQNVDGNETLADNVCDNAALRIAWLGYQLWMEDFGAEQKLPGVNFTIPQVFYIVYSQVCFYFEKHIAINIIEYIAAKTFSSKLEQNEK